MPSAFNHTIVAVRDKRESAEFVSEPFGLAAPARFGRFLVVALEHGATLDFVDVADDEHIHPQHYAFLVSDADFDAVYGRIRSRDLPHWADRGRQRAGGDQHR